MSGTIDAAYLENLIASLQNQQQAAANTYQQAKGALAVCQLLLEAINEGDNNDESPKQ